MERKKRAGSFTQEMADKICDRLANGESLRAICRDDDMPPTSTVCKWLSERPEFVEQYARAREAQADAIFDEILEIADDASNDWMERFGDENAGWQANGEHIQRSKLRIDSRKWMASKLAPKKYGERITNEITGKDGEPLIRANELAESLIAHVVGKRDPEQG